ncbi:hypothetical protein LTR95_000673 [Oleoguttula sp. CCFEE 5521]
MKAFITLLALLSAYTHAAPLSIPIHKAVKDDQPKDLEQRGILPWVAGLGLGGAVITAAGLTAGLIPDKHDKRGARARALKACDTRRCGGPPPDMPRHKYPGNYDEQQWCIWGLDWKSLGGDCRIEEPIDVPKAYAVDAKGRLVEESHRPAYGTCFAQRNEGYHHYCVALIKSYGSVGSQSGGMVTITGDLKHGSLHSIQTGASPSANGTYFASITPEGPGLRSTRPVTMKDGELFTTGNATVVPGRKVWIEPTR